jgi:hypothetical protein
MTDPETPMMVNADPLPAQLATLLRYVLTTLGGYAIAKGWITGDALEMVTSIVLVAAPMLYGIWRTQRNKADLVRVASAAPDSVAVVKGATA